MNTSFVACSKQSTCPYCGVGCGVDVDLLETNKFANKSLEATNLSGSREHPANFGRLCVKGTHLLETTSPEGRLLVPSVNGREVEWDEASDLIAQKMQDTIAEHGPNSVAFYVSGQLLTEDYYVANKLMKGFIGSGNIDTNSRLCMSSAVAGYKRAFGADAVPCNYEDLEIADVLVLVGSNAAWTHPVLFQRMEQAKKRKPNMKVIVVDPRKTATASLADIALHIKPGTDTILFNGLLNYLRETEALDQAFVKRHTNNFADTIRCAESYTVDAVSELCDVARESVEAFYAAFATSKRSVTFYSMGVNQSVSGVDNANAIINCHLASGQIGKPGCGPFSITGQPNAMGGREVGGLANMLAAHMDIENPQHHDLVSRFWHSSKVTSSLGLKAVDMFDALESGQIKFIWIMATNPVVSMPNRQKVERALAQCEFVVVSDCVAKNDTLAFANVVLPATGWAEKDGTVTNSERRISRQRALFPPTGKARHDWQIISEVGVKMGFEKAFSYSSPAEIFDEHAALSAFENKGSRDFNLAGLVGMTPSQYEQLSPIQWPVRSSNKQDTQTAPELQVSAAQPSGTARLFTDNIFFTHNQKANFVPIIPKLPEQLTCSEFPFVLNTGRSRDHWHTMTRTGNSARLHQHTGHAELNLHPFDAKALGIKEHDLLALNSVNNPDEPVILPAKFTRNQRQGECFAPIHWSKAWSSHVHIASLFSNARDAISGQPELKHAAINITKVTVSASAQIYTRQALPELMLEQVCNYWTKTKLTHGYQYELALVDELSEKSTVKTVENVHAWFEMFLENFAEQSQVHSLQTGTELNALKLVDGSLSLVAFFQQSQFDTKRDSNQVSKQLSIAEQANWVDSLLGQMTLSDEHARNLLRKVPSDEFTQGRLVCSCFNVREKSISSAIEQGCDSVEKLGEKLKCGTNCGSCRSELATLIANERIEPEAKHNSEIEVATQRSTANSTSNRQLTIPIKQIEALK